MAVRKGTATHSLLIMSTTPLRRSPRLAQKRAADTEASLPMQTQTQTQTRVYKKQKKQKKENGDTMMTEEDFNAFNDSLSEEDKELQASLLMWCIMNSTPYTLALFEMYKYHIQLLKNNGLL